MAATETTLPAIRLAREFGRGDTYAERVDHVTGLPELIAACDAIVTWDVHLQDCCGLARKALKIALEGRQ